MRTKTFIKLTNINETWLIKFKIFKYIYIYKENKYSNLKLF